MYVIKMQMFIYAPIHRVFDLARSIDLHSISTSQTSERAIDGTITGLIALGETVTWQATHFGIRQQLQSKITALQYPFYFRDEMLKGAFKSIYHEHFFEEKEGFTLMTDVFQYELPFGYFGELFNYFVLNKYMQRFIAKRNAVIKQYAETDEWKTILNQQ